MNMTHFHLLLNHFPVLGVLFGLGLLIYAFWRRSFELKRAAFGLFVITALVSIPAYLTGEPSEDAVKGLPGVSKAIIEQHEELAAVAITGSTLLALFSTVGLLWFWRRQEFPRWVSAVVLICALGTSVAMGWTANLGGQIRHTEIRSQGASQTTKEYSLVPDRTYKFDE